MAAYSSATRANGPCRAACAFAIVVMAGRLRRLSQVLSLSIRHCRAICGRETTGVQVDACVRRCDRLAPPCRRWASETEQRGMVGAMSTAWRAVVITVGVLAVVAIGLSIYTLTTLNSHVDDRITASSLRGEPGPRGPVGPVGPTGATG